MSSRSTRKGTPVKISVGSRKKRARPQQRDPYIRLLYTPTRPLNRTGVNNQMTQGHPSGFFPRKRVTLRYSEMKTININAPGTGTGSNFTSLNFRCMNPYDPDPLPGPFQHQPLNYDIWASLYNHVTIVGAKCTVRFVDIEGFPHTIVGVHLNDVAAAPYQKAQTYIESKRGPYGHLINRMDRAMTLTCNFSTKRFFNVKDIKDNQSRFGRNTATGTAIGATTEEAFFNIWACTQVGGAAVINLEITIDYICDFSEPKDRPESA